MIFYFQFSRRQFSGPWVKPLATMCGAKTVKQPVKLSGVQKDSRCEIGGPWGKPLATMHVAHTVRQPAEISGVQKDSHGWLFAQHRQTPDGEFWLAASHQSIRL